MCIEHKSIKNIKYVKKKNLRPTILVDAKFEARPIFRARPKFGTKPTKFEAESEARPILKPGQARPGQVLGYAV